MHINYSINQFKLRKNRLALVMYILLNNNPITQTTFGIMTLIDFGIQLVIILCLYYEFGCFPTSLNKITKIMDFNDSHEIGFPLQLMVFSYLLLLLIAILVLILLKEAKRQNNDRHILYKILSFGFGLLRSFPLTVFILICINNIVQANTSEQNSIEYLQIAFGSISLFLLVFYVYISSQCFNIQIPSKKIPWADVSTQPFAIDAFFKTFLILIYSLRDSGYIAKYILCASAISVIIYKVAFVIRRSFIFNRTNSIISTLSDILMIHLIFFLLFANAIQDGHFIIYVVIMYPITAVASVYFLNKFKVKWLISNLDQLDGKPEKVIAFQQMLSFYLRNDSLTQYYLYQIMSSHYFECSNYAQQIEDELIFTYKMKQINFEELSPNKELMPLINNENNIDEEFKIEEDATISNSVSIDFNNLSSMRLQNTAKRLQSTNRNEGPSEFNIAKSFNNQKNTSKNNIIQKYQQNRLVQQETLQSKGKQKEKQRISSDLQRRKALDFSSNGMPEKMMTDLKYQIPKSKKEKDKNLKKLLKHYFKHHLMQESQQDYRYKLLKIYFTLRILKNPFLAYFFLIELENSAITDNFMQRNVKLMHQKFLHQMIIDKHSQSDINNMTLHLQGMLEVNQLQQKFENQIDETSTQILNFWQSLLKERDIFHTFENGIEISAGIQTIKSLYTQIEKKQVENKENKFYLQMAAFYKLVIFKQQDYYDELQKSKFAFQNRTIDREKVQTGTAKGIVMCQLQFKSLMEIQLINKECCEILDYEKEEAMGMKLNAIMPSIVSENHTKFISKFMQTGKPKVINVLRNLFVKNRQGYMIPVKIFLYINYLNQGSQIMIIELNNDYQIPGYCGDELILPGIIICDSQTNVMELSKSAEVSCGLTYHMLKHIDSNTSKQALIDDLFQQVSRNHDIKDDLKNGELEFEVKIKYTNLISIVQEEITHFNSNFESHKSLIFGSKNPTKYQTPQLKQAFSSLQNFPKMTFLLRFHREYFLEGDVEMIIGGIYPLFDQGVFMSFNPNRITNSGVDQHFGSQDIDGGGGLNGIQSFYVKQKVGISEMRDKLNDMSSGGSENNTGSLSASQTSSTTSVLQSFNQYANVVNDQKIPRTLKFILQIVIGVFLIMVVISIISLVLVMINLQQAKWSLDVSKIALMRLNSVRSVRLVFRHVLGLANGYMTLNDTYITNRYDYYLNVLQENLNEFLDLETQILNLNSQFEYQFKIGMINIDFNGTEYTEQKYISQGIYLFGSYIQDIINQAKAYGPTYLKSDAKFLNIISQTDQISNTYEKNAYFVLANANGAFSVAFRDNAWDFNAQQESLINQKVQFSSTISWICMSLVIICGIIIIPLMGRIQNRILQLMRIFFQIHTLAKKNMINRIIKFKSFINSTHSILNHVEKDDQIVDEGQRVSQTIKQKSSGQSLNNLEAQQFSWASKDIKHKADGDQQDKIHKAMGIKLANTDNNRRKSIANEENQEKDKKKTMKEKKSKKNEDVKEEEDQSDIVEISDINIATKDIDTSDQVKVQQQMLNSFKTYINQKKLIQSGIIMVIACSLSAYFIATYFVSASCFTEMSDAMNTMSYVFSRLSQAENSLTAVYETFIWNKTLFVNSGKDEQMEYFIDTGLQREKFYQEKVIKDKPVYMSQLYDYIEIIEGRQFCDYVFNQNRDLIESKSYFIGSQNCSSFNKNIALNGLSSIYYQIYQATNQLKISYFSMIQTKTGYYKKFFEALNGNFIKLIDTVYLILEGPQVIMQNKMSDSIRQYFNQQINYFIIMFVVFILILLLVLLFFVLSKIRLMIFLGIFKRLKKEMLLSNKLLYIIDFEEITDEQRNTITKFLTKY